jgi:hypothetical protein
MTTFTAQTTVRFATEADREQLDVLARLDSTVPLVSPVLVGESAGLLVAAISLADGRVAADPFRPTAFAPASRLPGDQRRRRSPSRAVTPPPPSPPGCALRSFAASSSSSAHATSGCSCT